MLETKWVFFEWPFGEFEGQEVRRYHTLFNRFNIENWGNRIFVVKELGKVNYRGGPDAGIQFNTLREALDYVENMVH